MVIRKNGDIPQNMVLYFDLIVSKHFIVMDLFYTDDDKNTDKYKHLHEGHIKNDAINYHHSGGMQAVGGIDVLIRYIKT